MADRRSDAGDALPVAAMLGEIGSQIRSIRKDAGLTLEQLSERSGLSTGIVSQIERGLANPSFATLAQLAHGLDIPVGRLFQVSDHSRSPVVRRSERRVLGGHGLDPDDESRFELLTPDLNGALEVTWVETRPGHDTSANPFRHQGEEFGLILSGRTDVYLDGQRHELHAGDSIRYLSTIPHWYVNPGDEVCTAIWVITPPSW
jgi:transcriptional regulator with XRE-family HTH domain